MKKLKSFLIDIFLGKPKKKISLSIPNPCSKDWEQMTPEGKNRHCGFCSTTVVDFTNATDKEMIDFFSNPQRKKERVCIRAYNTELNRPLIDTEPYYISIFRRLVLSIAIAVGLTSRANGQLPPRVTGKVVAKPNPPHIDSVHPRIVMHGQMKAHPDPTTTGQMVSGDPQLIPILVVTHGLGVSDEFLDPWHQALYLSSSNPQITITENIYYPLSEYKVSTVASKILDKAVDLLKKNPQLRIELSSHTDSRGSEEFNLSLSEKRAKAAVAYIVSKGISADRLTGKGYGDQRLLNKCAKGVKCTEAEHQQNRRTEFKVIYHGSTTGGIINAGNDPKPAQNNTSNPPESSTPNNDMVFEFVQQMPQFPGDMYKYISEHIQYPEAEKEASIAGTVYVKFVIEKDGSITGIKVLRGVPGGPGLDKEAIRIISTMPKWLPGKQDGNIVRVQYNMGVKFNPDSK